jgi:thiazole synthase
MLTDFIDPRKITYLPNTAGCFTADDAIRTLRLAREAGGWDLVKLEVLGEARTLYPDMRETLKATEVLAREGFLPMVYCVDDPIAAKQLEEAGAVAVMPLGAPIGSGLGIQNRVTIRLIVEGASVPVLVDAGVGTASDAAVAMELGCDGVLMNTAIAEAKDPMRMARAMKLAVEAGRDAYLAGRMATRKYADPSSPLAGFDLTGDFPNLYAPLSHHRHLPRRDQPSRWGFARIRTLGSGPIKCTVEASKWQRYRSKMPAADSHSTGKGILFRDQSHFGVRRI